ncbi:hypothetical protein MKX01_039818 [Papaver californicum]|nr:hypothetical protein MKX01_039818 [Papaver californicum]
MGRRKIEIERIDDTNKRMVTFSKRRNRLISKAAHLCKFCSDIVLIVFSPAGKPYTFSNSSLDNMKSKNSLCIQQCRKKNHVVLGSDHDDNLWWDNIDMEKLDYLEKLMSIRNSLADLKQNLTARLEKLTLSSTPLSSSSPSSTIQDLIVEYTGMQEAATTMAPPPTITTTTTNKKHNTGKTWWKDRPELDHNFELQQSDKKAIISMLEDEVRGQDEEVDEPSTILAL